MKKFALKSVATVVGVGLSGVAAAQVDLNNDKSTGYKFASEANVSADKGTTVGNNMTTKMQVGVAFNKDTTAYVRFDLSSGNFESNPTLACDGGVGVTVTDAVPGGKSAQAIFAVINTAGIKSTDACTLTAKDVSVKSQAAITITGRVFETLTNSINPTTSNALNTKSGTFLTWTPALTFTPSNGTNATAIVSKGYKEFKSGAAATLGSIKLEESGALLTTGVAAKFTDIVASSVTTVTGDYSFVKDKTAVTLGGVAADTVAAAGPATFKNAVTTGTSDLVVTAEGKNAIKAGSYTGSVALTAKDGFTIANPSSGTVGTIVRDGNQLLIPLAQNSAALGGYVSRFSLVNRGTADAAYTVTLIQEDGGTATLASSAASGTVKGNSTRVVDLTGAAASGALQGRGALLVTVEAAANTISGTYQITNLNSGAVSNQSMIVIAP